MQQSDIIHFSPFIYKGSPLEWLVAIGYAIVIALIAKAILRFVGGRLREVARKTAWKWDDVLVACLDNTRIWALFIWTLHPLGNFIEGEVDLHRAVYIVFVVLTTLQVGIWGSYSLRSWQKDYLSVKVSHDASAASAINLLITATNVVFFAALLMICLSNLGVNIGAMLAGMGIGGIAIALAAQNILGDLFGSLSIVLDKPFVVGDYIVVGNDQGTVENIGIKTTRVRSLTGEELIFSNKDLLESRVKNFKRMWKRRVSLKFGVPFETSSQILSQIPQWIKGFIEEEKLLSFERSHFSEIGASSFNIETIFWVTDPDYNKYMDLQQILLFKIINRLRDEKVSIALPAQAFQLQDFDEDRAEQTQKVTQVPTERRRETGPAH
ncbi:mechanosensitive ion channel family protein [Bdellovibrio sp. NC01]|uniref:mechanosensitive ion channel family protein n=1 Tax=Bdellovibrio sp. NC01 TaxID=2220073 RepID=UPI00115C43BA|nr:mechanosensitive ion channel family protein [Bdellovibrio sp. NC01]QDK37902.1 mechanosensitive ion channel family protein [Bdellovibrio sp. NC01]